MTVFNNDPRGIGGITVMKWPCLECSDLLSKNERQAHSLLYDHKVSEVGQRQYPANEIIEVPIEDEKVEEYKVAFKSEWTGKARQDYPECYEVFDAIRGLLVEVTK